MPMATDMPAHVDLHHIETPSPLNPLGVKGAGEGGTIAAIAAIVGAVENALSPFAVRIIRDPDQPAAHRRAGPTVPRRSLKRIAGRRSCPQPEAMLNWERPHKIQLLTLAVTKREC